MTKSSKFQFGNVFTITIAHFVHDVYSSFLAPLLPLLIEKIGMSYSLAGLLTVFQRLPALLNPFIGMVADKMPVRYFLIVSPAITSICMSLLGLAPSYLALVVLLLVMGISSSMFHVPSPVMVVRVSGSRVGKGMGLFMFGGELASSVAPVFVLGAVSLWGLEGIYRLIPVGLIASLILYIKFRNVKISEEFKSTKAEENKSVGSTFKEFLPLFGLITGIHFFITMLKSAFSIFLPTLITSEGNSIWMGGLALAALQFTGAIGTILSGSISDKMGRKKTLLLIVIISPILTFMFLFSHEVIKIIILVILGFFLISSTSVILAIVNEVKSDHPSFINGIQMMINFGVSAVTVFMVGVMGDLFGLQTTYIIAAFLSFFAIPFILKLESK